MGMSRRGYVYILASQRNGTLYVGVTSDLVERVWEHRQDLVESFTKRYGVHRLVYYEIHAEIAEAIRREKRIKKWERGWKIRLVEQMNPDWQDLFEDLVGKEEAGIRSESGPGDPGFPPARE
jgi:putative endonuclease